MGRARCADAQRCAPRGAGRAPVITAPEGWAFEYSRFQEAQKREIVEHSYLVAQAHQIVEQAHKVALEASSSGRAANHRRSAARPDSAHAGQHLQAGRDGRAGLPRSGRRSRRLAGIGQLKPGSPRSWPCRRNTRGAATGAPAARAGCGGHRRLAHLGIGGRDRLRRGTRRGVDLVALHAWSDMGPSTFLGSIGRRSNGETSKTSRRKCSPGV